MYFAILKHLQSCSSYTADNVSRFFWTGIHPSSPFFLVPWYSPSFSLCFCFTWMLLEHPLWVREGGYILHKSLMRCFGITSLNRHRVFSLSSTVSLRSLHSWTRPYRKGDTTVPLTGWQIEDLQKLQQDSRRASWHRARYELASMVSFS